MKKVVIDAGSATLFGNRRHLSGVGRTTLELIRALERETVTDIRIELFIQRLRGTGLKQYGLGFRQHRLPLPRRREFDSLLRRLPLIETFTGADLLHIPHNYGPACRMDRTVLTIHDAIFLRCFESHLHDRGEAERVLDMGRKVAKIITCSECSKRDLVEGGGLDPEKIEVIPWGYDRSTFRVLAPEDAVFPEIPEKPYLLSVSCDVGRKQTPELIRAYLSLAQDGYPYDLVLVWGNPPESLLAEVAQSKAGHRIHFLSGVSDACLAGLYNRAAATVFPSRYEGFGLPVLESMACGTPVVTCRNSSLPEVGGDAAIYLDSPDREAIAAGLEKLGRGQYDLEPARERGLAQAAKFDWGVCARRTLDVYRSIVL